MNYVAMMGRLTADPNTGIKDETSYARFRIAVDRQFKKEGQPDADFFNCVAFGKRAENIGKYFSKGTKVIIQGRLQNNDYVNKDGVKIQDNNIMVDNIEFAESKAASQRYKEEHQDQAAPQPQPQSAPQSSSNNFMAIPDSISEELPFS